MKTILVPTDFSIHSEKALDYAVEIAKHSNARIIIVHTYNLPIFDPNVPASILEEMLEDEKDRIEKELMKICQKINDTSTIDSKNLHGEFITEFNLPVSAISRISKEKNVDLIIMGTEREEHFLLLMGSTTIDVSDRVKCPVLVVKDTTSFQPLKNIYYAVENIKEDLPALEQLIPIARLFNSEVILIHVNKYADNINELSYIQKERDEDELILSEFKKKHNYSNISLQFRFADETFDSLLKILHNENVDLITLLKHERNWLENFFHKSVTKSVIKNSELPLLILHK